MLDRLKAEGTRELIEALLASNQRVMNDGDRKQYMRELGDREQGGAEAPKRAAAASLGFLKRAGVQMAGPDDTKGGDE